MRLNLCAYQMSFTFNAPMSLSRPRKRQRLELNAELFQHEPLDISKPHIRLVRLVPITQDGHLKLELRNNVSLDTRSKYQALSYEWGPERAARAIFINDKLLMIRKNLYLFLESLYNDFDGADSLGFLWVDALCIDQENFDERNHQVRHMAEIYKRAHQVLAWLGPCHNSHVGETFRLIRQYHDDLGKGSTQKPRRHTFGNKSTLPVLESFFRRSYWSRAWIVQELVLGKNVMIFWGKYAITLPAIISAYLARGMYELEDSDMQNCVATLGYIEFERNANLVNRSLLQILMNFGTMSCTVPHDKIYAILGLSEDSNVIKVDYNIPIERLFLAALETVSEATQYEYVYNLCRDLGIFIVTTGDGLSLWRRPRSAMKKMKNLSTPSLTNRMFLKGERVMHKSFKWHFRYLGESFPSLGQTLLSNLQDDENWCHCPACAQKSSAKPTLQQISSSTAQNLEMWHALGSRGDPEPGYIRGFIPELCLLLDGGRYLATVLNCTQDIDGYQAYKMFFFHDRYIQTDIITTVRKRKTGTQPRPTSTHIQVSMASCLSIVEHALAEHERTGYL